MTPLRLVLALLAFGASAASAQVLNRGNGGEPGTLDPAFAGSSSEATILGDLMVGLTTLDAGGRPMPGVAESWTVSPDGLDWSFHLRAARWSDGSPLTAADFTFAWRRLLDPKTGSGAAYNLWVLKNARAISAGKLPPAALGVDAPAPDRLVLHLAHPVPYLPELLALPAAAPVPHGARPGWTRPGAYVSDGPYTLKEWVPSDHITLARNPLFYDAVHVRIGTVNYIPTPDPESALRRFRAGELDMLTPVPLSQLAWLRANMPKALHVMPSLAINYVAFCLAYPPLRDARVRRAINLAYNREAVVRQVLKLNEPPAYTYVPPGVNGYRSRTLLDFHALPMDARLAQARSLMQAAGYGPGRPLHLVLTTATNPDARRLAALLQAMLRPIFVEIEIDAMEFSSTLGALHAHSFELATASWVADVDDASNFLDLLRSGASYNYAGYDNPRFDAALDAAESQADPARRAALLADAETIALGNLPWLVLRYASQTEVVGPEVRGYVENNRDANRTRWLWKAK